mgnify:FL=1
MYYGYGYPVCYNQGYNNNDGFGSSWLWIIIILFILFFIFGGFNTRENYN